MVGTGGADRSEQLAPVAKTTSYRVASGVIRRVYLAVGVLLALGIWGPIYLLGGPAPTDPIVGTVFALIAAVIAVMFLGGAVLMWRAVARVRLEVGPEGVAYRSIGYTLAAPWSNVEAIEWTLLGSASGDALVVRDATTSRGTFLKVAGILTTFRVQTMSASAWSRHIPLTAFADPLRGSDLEADLRRYVPDVVDRYEQTTHA